MTAPALQTIERPGTVTGRAIRKEQTTHTEHTWAEARRLAFDCASPLGPEGVPLEEASGRTLVADVVAVQDLPHYASSAMDGWTVSGDGPWTLTEPGQPLGSGEASPVVTGGVIPPASPGEPRPGQHIRKAGEEAAAGEVLIPAGTALNPAHIALAAVAGFDQLVVGGKPLVKMLVTGSEVVTAKIPAPGQVRDAFGPQLSTVIQMLGGVPGPLVRIGDSYGEWLTALGASEAPMGRWPDVVVTTGGTGRSGADHFRNAVAALGGRLLIDGIAMRPGHRAALAKLPNGRFVVGLPGNPLAALMALFTVGGPLLAALGHQPLPGVRRVLCGTAVEAHRVPTRLMPFRWVNGMAAPAQFTGSGKMRGLTSADGVMAVPSRGAQPGEPVPAFALPWRPALQPSLPGDLVWGN